MKTEDRLEKLEKKVDEMAAIIDTIINKPMPTKSSTEERESIKEESSREFLLKFNPKSDTDKTLVAIKFLEKKGVQPITALEISDALKEMREAPPQNISDKIQLLDRRGMLKFVGQEGKRKCWLISNTGEEYLRRLHEDAK